MRCSGKKLPPRSHAGGEAERSQRAAGACSALPPHFGLLQERELQPGASAGRNFPALFFFARPCCLCRTLSQFSRGGGEEQALLGAEVQLGL